MKSENHETSHYVILFVHLLLLPSSKYSACHFVLKHPVLCFSHRVRKFHMHIIHHVRSGFCMKRF
jgi:hypothetical protein